MRILSRSDVDQALTMAEAIPVVRTALSELSAGTARIPDRIALAQERYAGEMLVMPGYLDGSKALGAKLLTLRDRNPARNLPLIHGVLVLFDAEAGKPLAMIEAGRLTALRTGAASGVATDLLAKQEAETAAIFGAGVQARTQLLAVCAVRPIRRALIYDAVPARATAFIDAMAPALPGVELLPAESPAACVRAADIVCTATTSAVPVFNGEDLQPGAHVNSIGSYKPDRREVESTVLRRASKIAVDFRGGVLAEAGDVLIPLSEGVIDVSQLAEIGEIAAGRRPPREREDEITFFKSVGNAALDLAAGDAAYRRACERGLGTEVELL